MKTLFKIILLLIAYFLFCYSGLTFIDKFTFIYEFFTIVFIAIPLICIALVVIFGFGLTLYSLIKTIKL